VSRVIIVSNRSWLLPDTDAPLARVHESTTVTTIDKFGRPRCTQIISKRPGNRGRKMREVFTTSGYAILDDGVKLSTPNGLASLQQLSRGLLAGDKVLVESLRMDSAVGDFRDTDVLSSPGAVQLEKTLVSQLVTNVHASFDSKNESAIPRVCFSSVPAILGHLGKKHQPIYCEVDNKLYPSEIFVRAGENRETELLAITDFFEDETTMLEISGDCKAMIVDGLVCA
jgi:hypothetical protein